MHDKSIISPTIHVVGSKCVVLTNQSLDQPLDWELVSGSGIGAIKNYNITVEYPDQAPSIQNVYCSSFIDIREICFWYIPITGDNWISYNIRLFPEANRMVITAYSTQEGDPYGTNFYFDICGIASRIESQTGQSASYNHIDGITVYLNGDADIFKSLHLIYIILRKLD